MESFIEVKNLKKYYKLRSGILHAVEDISFSVNRGMTLGVVGESGCGKSTLGKTILRLVEPTSGEILLEGEDILKFGRRDRTKIHRNMQMIFQDPYASLDPRMLVKDIIAEPLRVCEKKLSRSEISDRVMEVAAYCGLQRDSLEKYPFEIDSGFRQRVGLSRAMIVKPSFIVCDEPVSALDVSIQAQILNTLDMLRKKNSLSYLFITHDLAVVRHISNAIMVMYMGCVVEYAETEELFNNPLHPYTKALLAAVPTISLDSRNKPIQLLEGEVTSPVNPPQGCRFKSRCPFASPRCDEPVSLRDIGNGHKAACTLL